VSGLPTNQLFSSYISGTGFKELGGASLLKSGVGSTTFGELPGLTPGPGASDGEAVSVDQNGLSLTTIAAGDSALSRSRAGLLAAQLPANVEGFVSIQGVRKAIASGLSALSARLPAGQFSVVHGDYTSYIRQLEGSLGGEVDLVVFHPQTPMPASSGPAGIPAAVLWQVSSTAAAIQALQQTFHEAHITPLARRVAPDGSAYYATAAGYGYAVRQGWAIASLDIPAVMDQLTGSLDGSLARVAVYEKAVPVGATPSAILYIDASSLRETLESVMLPRVGADIAAQYRSQFNLDLTPILSLEGSSGILRSETYSTIRLDVGSGTR